MGIGQEARNSLHRLVHSFLVDVGTGACPSGTGLYRASRDGTRKRFPPIRVTIPWRENRTEYECYT